jgi:hypothetical protein
MIEMFSIPDKMILAKSLDLYVEWVKQQEWKPSEKAVTFAHVTSICIQLGLMYRDEES